jgi:excisionase family DNA binding protein
MDELMQRFTGGNHGGMNEAANAPVIGSEECAALLCCTKEQIEELARAGDLPGTKIGRAWRFLRADVLTWLSERAHAEAQERRAKRQPQLPKQRRRVPPALA